MQRSGLKWYRVQTNWTMSSGLWKPNWSLYFNDTGAVVREGICDIIESKGVPCNNNGSFRAWVIHTAQITVGFYRDCYKWCYHLCIHSLDCQHATSSRILILSWSVEWDDPIAIMIFAKIDLLWKSIYPCQVTSELLCLLWKATRPCLVSSVVLHEVLAVVRWFYPRFYNKEDLYALVIMASTGLSSWLRSGLQRRLGICTIVCGRIKINVLHVACILKPCSQLMPVM